MTGRRRGIVAGAWVAAAGLAAGLAALAPAAPAAPKTAAPDLLDTLRVEAEVGPAVVRIGERITVRLAFAAPDTASRLVGPPAPSRFGPVDVLRSEPGPAGPDSLAWLLEVGLFRTGDLDLGGVPFLLQTEAGTHPLRLRPYRITVEPSLPDTLGQADIRDIRDPVDLAVRWRWGRIVGATVLAVLLIAGWGWWVRRPRSLPAPVAILEPSIPPDQAALAALSALEREALPARGQIKEHYARLSLILRGYLERCYPLPAVESTTEEIRAALETRGLLDVSGRAAALELLEASDLVKFARHDPGPAAADAALARERAWVQEVSARRPDSPAPSPATDPVEAGPGEGT